MKIQTLFSRSAAVAKDISVTPTLGASSTAAWSNLDPAVLKLTVLTSVRVNSNAVARLDTVAILTLSALMILATRIRHLVPEMPAVSPGEGRPFVLARKLKHCYKELLNLLD